MADLKISQLDAISSLVPATDVLPVVSGGVTKKITTNQILGSSGVALLASATITGDLTVDTSTLKVDSTNNRVGIGTATPGVRCDILSDNNTSLAAILRVNSNNAAVNTALAYDGLIASGGMTLQAGTSSPIVFNTNGANESGRINTTGVYVLKGGTTTANGVGVAFPATQVASSDANCLDDYEEGTWSPTPSGEVNLTSVVSVSARYTKVGRLVTLSGQVTATVTLPNILTYFLLPSLPFANGTVTTGAVQENGNLTVGAVQVNINNLYGFFPVASAIVSGAATFNYSVTYSV